MSMPNLPKSPDESGTSSGVQTPATIDQPEAAIEQIQNLKQRSVTSLPSQSAQAATERTGSVSKPVRSPSFASPAPSAPSVAVDGSNVDAVRSSEAPLPAKRWIGRNTQPASKRDAVDAIREMNDRVAPKESAGTPQSPRTATIREGDDEDHPEIFSNEPEELEDERRGSAGSKSSVHLDPNTSISTPAIPRTPSRESLARTDTMSSTQSSQNSQTRGKALFAATAAATSAARQWSLNALANRKQGSPLFRNPNAAKPGPQEPVGRGQPLPPIGQPLPGPKTSLWGNSAFAGGSVRRKPVLPARQPTMDQDQVKTDESEPSATLSSTTKAESTPDTSVGANVPDAAVARKSEEDEFGAWNENYGESVDNEETVQVAPTHNLPRGVDQKPIADEKHEQTEHISKIAPPLPARRKHAPDLPKRPHERAAVLAAQSKTDSAAERQQSVASDASKAPQPVVTDDSRPAIPAPVIDAQAEERGTLELEEADGVLVIDAPKDGSDKAIASSDHVEGGPVSKNVTMEEVPEEPAGGNAAAT
jgi:hypothetical protein